eukprot:2367047-Pyramimonas_sp.AAC.1
MAFTKCEYVKNFKEDCKGHPRLSRPWPTFARKSRHWLQDGSRSWGGPSLFVPGAAPHAGFRSLADASPPPVLSLIHI